MKHLMTLVALLVSSLAMAQMPYNPDSNGDNMVGSGDLLTFLTFYGNELIQSDLTCDYEGTELEQLFGGLFEQSLVLDSVYLEYLLIDSVETFLPGCPDPVVLETIIERGLMLTLQIGDNFNIAEPRIRRESYYLDYLRRVQLSFSPSNGYYKLEVWDSEVGSLTSFSQSTDWNSLAPNGISSYTYLPFPDTWSLDANGINVDYMPSGWVANCENFRLIPFWSVAE